MSPEDAKEAGMLAAAFERLPGLAAALRAEIDGPFENATPWKTFALEFWGRDHEDDSAQEHIGDAVPLPPAMALRLVTAARDLIEFRLRQLGVDVP